MNAPRAIFPPFEWSSVARPAIIAWAASALWCAAQVQVDFSHSYIGGGTPDQNTGDITLAFTVDGSGNVTLDASCALPLPATYVDEFDGPVGTLSDPALWGQNFTLVLSSTGSGALRINNTGGGLAVQGGNAQLIDADAGGGNEVIIATVTAAGMQFNLLGLGYVGAAGGAGMNVAGTAYALSGGSGTVDVSAQGVTGTFTVASTASVPGQGFVLSSLSFDLVADTTGVQVGFSHSYTGPAGENPQNTGNITLAFTVDGFGNTTLDASCADPDAATYVDEFDGPVGMVSDPAMWGQNFTLALSSTGIGNLRIDNAGAGLAIQGGSPQLVDSTNEQITVTVTAAGTQFNLLGVGFDGAASNPQMDVAGTGYPLSGTSGTVDVSAQGVGGTFTIASIANSNSQGFVLSALWFDLVGGADNPEFDNGGGDNRWTTAANWNPDGVPVAPSNAVIDGYDVVVDTAVAAGPAGLQILDGSLTLTGSGALSVESMEIGEEIASTVRLIVDGSAALFGYSGASGADAFTVGSSATVETRAGATGSSPLELGVAQLTLDVGSEWILDGSNHTGSYTVGDRFVLANFGSFSGSTGGLRTRNFDLPADRSLQLVANATSLYYEVVAQTPATGPNIIIINTDDQAGGQHFGFEGRDCLTPTIDLLAAAGIRFTSAFAASTVCGPSRYALLTSRWPSRNTSARFIARYPLGTLGRFGVSDTELEPDGQHLGAWLRQAGYRTGMVGKGHLTDDDLNQTANWPAKGLMTYPQTAEPASDATTNGKMRHNHRVLCQRMRALGFDYVASYYKANLLELRNDALNVHNQEWITRGALDFIEENYNQRFFLYMAPTVNHGPVRNDLTKTLRADKRYTSAGYLPNEDYSFMPARQAIIDEVTNAGKDLISARETWLDYSVAALLDKLTQHGIRDDTLIIFTSDHGEKTLSGPLIWGKSSLYDLGMRVPFVMNWPNGITSPGRVYGEIVSQVDIAPTLLALTGASGLPTRPVDGVSLVPVLDGGSAAVRDALFCEIGYARAVRTLDRKYIAVRYTPSIYSLIESGFLWTSYKTGLPTEPRPYYVNNSQLGGLVADTNPTYFDDDQLYDLVADPDEDNNLYGQEPSTAYDLKKRLANYMGGIPNRPYREFDDASTEFSPAPAGVPSVPGGVQMQFLGVDTVQLDWSDASDNELGFVVRQSTNGAPFEILSEVPSASTSATVAVSSGVEDIVLQVSSYNAVGDAAAAEDIDLLAPDNWRYRIFGSTTSSNSQWTADADGDGLVTVWEYAFATDPLDSNSTDRILGEAQPDGSNTWLQIVVPRDRRRDVSIEGRVSTNLSDWVTGEPHTTVAEDTDAYLRLRSTTPMEAESAQYLAAETTDP